MSSRRWVWIAGVTGSVAALGSGACASKRDSFESDRNFVLEAGADAPACEYQCSIDGRAIVSTCTGEVVETCAPEQACGAARCQEPCAAAAAGERSDGCEFFFQTPRYRKDLPHSCFAVYVVNTSNGPVDLGLELEGTRLDISNAVYRTNAGDATLVPHTGSLAPGDSAIVFVSDRAPDAPIPQGTGTILAPCPDGVVPASVADPLPNGNGFGSAFHLKSTAPVAATSIYPFGGARSYLPSATLLLPVSTWSKEHMIVNGWEHGPSGVPGAQIIASEDDTEVTLIPKRDIQDGRTMVGSAANIPVTYRLARGQILQLAQNEELSGSVVTSTKPTTTFGGHSCAFVPSSGAYCDTLNQQIPGFERWGAKYVGVGYRPRLDNENELVAYRIVAARDGTVLDYDPAPPVGAPLTMSAGEVALFVQPIRDPFVVRTQDVDHPVYLAAYMSGAQLGFEALRATTGPSFGSQGDPEFVNVVPADQYLNAYSFYADPSYGNTSLVIVRAKTGDAFKDVWLECAGYLTGFRPVGTSGEYEYVRVDLARDGKPGATFDGGACGNGLHRLRSDGPFTATLWGWDKHASYAYPGGLAQRKLVTTPLVDVK
ncbi:MAG: IgGFc-binding protein [Myxococcales bacterium]|nr:IgGFc-binding protein [Myxococcales bacterium]